MAPLVSLLVVMRAHAARPDRLDRGSHVSMSDHGLAIVVVYYGLEEWVSAGRMSRSIVVAAGQRGVSPSRRIGLAARNLVLAVIWKCVGLIVLLAAAGLAVVAVPDQGTASASWSASTVLIGLLWHLRVLQFVSVHWPAFFGLLILGLLVIVAVVIPVCIVLEQSIRGRSIDVYLLALLAG